MGTLQIYGVVGIINRTKFSDDQSMDYEIKEGQVLPYSMAMENDSHLGGDRRQSATTAYITRTVRQLPAVGNCDRHSAVKRLAQLPPPCSQLANSCGRYGSDALNA